jgi:hypothetical protein
VGVLSGLRFRYPSRWRSIDAIGIPDADGFRTRFKVRVRGAEVAQMVVGERGPLSTQDREEILRHRMSYLEADLLVPAWSAAFPYGGNAGAESTLDILDFANSQLLEFRYYDQRLDANLIRIYAELQAACGRTGSSSDAATSTPPASSTRSFSRSAS